MKSRVLPPRKSEGGIPVADDWRPEVMPNPEVMPSAGDEDCGDSYSERTQPDKKLSPILKKLDHQSAEERRNEQQACRLGQHCQSGADAKPKILQGRCALARQRA